MFHPNVVSGDFVIDVGLLLAIMLLWNLAGRYYLSLQPSSVENSRLNRFILSIAGIVHVCVMAMVLFIVITFLVSGVITNPTDFRYVSF